MAEVTSTPPILEAASSMLGEAIGSQTGWIYDSMTASLLNYSPLAGSNRP